MESVDWPELTLFNMDWPELVVISLDWAELTVLGWTKIDCIGCGDF